MDLSSNDNDARGESAGASGLVSVTAAPRSSPGRQVGAVIGVVVVLAAVLGGLYVWKGLRSAGPGYAPPGPTPVAAMRVEPRDAPASLESVGSLVAVQEVTLAPEAAGRVTEIHFEPGTTVEAGALLVQLFDGPEQAERDGAQAMEKLAAIQLGRARKLVSTGAQAAEEQQQREAEHDQAAAAVRELEARLAQKQVRAPFAGEIGIRRVNLGQYLNPGDPVATLTALDPLYVWFSAPQQELQRLAPGSSVEVASDAFPGRTFTAKVDAVEPKIDEDTRNVWVEALLPNPDHALRPGMYVTASLVLPPEKGALVVPATAIATSAQGESVIVIRGGNAGQGGTAEIVPVQTGRRIGDAVVVTAGLAPGDVVVTEGQLRVQPGAQVTVARLVAGEE